MTSPLLIAIDGPAGSGKSTVAQRVAKKLGIFYLDTGAMYRAFALKVKRQNIDLNAIDQITSILSLTGIHLEETENNRSLKVLLDGEDVTLAIRQPEVSAYVSAVSKIKLVREHMVSLQRQMAAGRAAILEGRDTTTVVFPNATHKFYLDADPQERARRRYAELAAKNITVELAAVLEDIQRRDTIDSTREHSPLKKASDAVYIDTTSKSIDDVVELVIEKVNP